ncbi:hypothetical protein B0H17DRAFT_1130806 [Mycena rosella]|uniref:Uncharacterized protein n=1 Tax=Mycena rosella TaxID=1033263 RepID=A0AAD7GIQ8_MYCRO|nr:hypothetical protein B0H17DRAFT_1130806 [Mycena rosella]
MTSTLVAELGRASSSFLLGLRPVRRFDGLTARRDGFRSVRQATRSGLETDGYRTKRPVDGCFVGAAMQSCMPPSLVKYDPRAPNKLLPAWGILFASCPEAVAVNRLYWFIINLALFLFAWGLVLYACGHQLEIYNHECPHELGYTMGYFSMTAGSAMVFTGSHADPSRVAFPSLFPVPYHSFMTSTNTKPSGWPVKFNLFSRDTQQTASTADLPPFLNRLRAPTHSSGSVVAVEHIFSGGRNTIGLCRASLKLETIRMLMFVKARLHLEKEQARKLQESQHD